MKEFLILFCGLMWIYALVFGIPALVNYHRKTKNKKWFNSVQVGDQYIKDNRETNPFMKKWGCVIIILDKKIGTDGLMYIKYRYKDSTCKYKCTYVDLLETYHYVPYTGQDKE